MIRVYQIPLGFVRSDIRQHAPEAYGKGSHEFGQITTAESEMCRQFLKRYLVFKVSSDIRIYLLYSFEHVLRHLVPAVVIDDDVEMEYEQVYYRLRDRGYPPALSAGFPSRTIFSSVISLPRRRSWYGAIYFVVVSEQPSHTNS